MNKHIKTLLLCLVIFGCSKPDIAVHNGKGIFYQDTIGSLVVINYWADWCAPCIKELPELFEFAEENPDVLVYVYNFDDLDSEDLAPVAKRFNLKLPSLITHPRDIWGIGTPPAVPATFFIDPNGQLIESLFRPQTKDSLNEILEAIK